MPLMGIKTYFKWWKNWRSLPVRPWVRGAAYYRASNFRCAEEAYREGLERFLQHPAAPTARLDYAYCLFKNGKLADAESELKVVMRDGVLARQAGLRLARLQLWAGQPMEAAWTMRRLLRRVPADGETVATFLLSVLDNGGPEYLITEAVGLAGGLFLDERGERLLKVALAQYAIFRGEIERGKIELTSYAGESKACFDAVLLLAELLLNEGNIASARYHLRRALSVAPHHPRVLSLFAESYIRESPFFNADYAVQLASEACKLTNWSSPRELHVLAEAYLKTGDKILALLTAGKAKEMGSKLLGTYRRVKNLEQLIESISSGTSA